MNRTLLSSIRNAALLLWVALLPLQTRLFLHEGRLAGGPWEYGTLSVYATDVLLALAFLAALLSDQNKEKTKRLRVLPRLVVAGAVAVVVAVGISALNAVDVGVTIGIVLRFVLGLVAVWLVVTSNLPLSAFAVAITASASVEAIVVLWQFIAQAVPASTFFGLAAHSPSVAGDAVVETTIGRFLRPYGSLPHPNMAAGWLAFGLVFAAGLHLRSRDRIERAVILSAFLLVTAGLFLTFSRAGVIGWLFAFVPMVAYILFLERRSTHPRWHFGFFNPDIPLGLKVMKLVTASVLLLGVFLSCFSPLIAGRMDAAGRLEKKSLNERVAQFDDARALYAKYWFFGVGAGNYTKAVHDSVDSGREWWGYQPVHSVPLLVLAEVGSLGALVLLGFFGSVAIVVVRAIYHSSRTRQLNELPWVVVTAAGLLLIFLLSLPDHYLWSLPFGIAFSWLAVGLWLKSLSEK